VALASRALPLTPGGGWLTDAGRTPTGGDTERPTMHFLHHSNRIDADQAKTRRHIPLVILSPK